MIIYKVTNLLNGAVYIGQTNKTLEERIRAHKNRCFGKYYNRTKFYNGLRFYGWTNFSWELIDRADTQIELDNKEKYWIIHYDSTKSGYNILDGGMDYQPMNSEEVKQKHLSIVRSEKFRRKISKSITHDRYTEERNRKISKAMIGNLNGLSQAVPVRGINIKTGEVNDYISKAQAARALKPENITSAEAGIYNVLVGKRKSALGYRWQYLDTECVETIENASKDGSE